MKKLIFPLFILVMLATAAVFMSVMTPAAEAKTEDSFILDVAFRGPSFRNQEGVTPVVLLRGNTFIINGTIYPGGTIPSGDGVWSPDAPGGIGSFICRGTFNYDLVDILNGVPGSELEVATTQIYMLAEGRGLITEGLEGSVPTIRAVTGGMGSYSGASGEVRVERLGTNTSGDFNIRATFMLKKQAPK